MPKLIYDDKEIEEKSNSTVNKSGYAYVGRKHTGKQITWIKLKE